MTDRLASCTCGHLTARTRGEPLRVSICHCLACQRRSGSVFAAQARFPRGAVSVAGSSRQYARTGDEGGTARFHFCPVCGDTVYYLPDALPDVVMIPVGAFADPSFQWPQVSMYESRKHAWVHVPDGIENH